MTPDFTPNNATNRTMSNPVMARQFYLCRSSAVCVDDVCNIASGQFCAAMVLSSPDALRLGVGAVPESGRARMRLSMRAVAKSARHSFGASSGTMPISARRSAFRFAVRAVVGRCSEKKMIGIDASPIIAAMTNQKAIRNGAAINDPGKSVRAPYASGSSVQTTISALKDAALPFPTLIGRFGRNATHERRFNLFSDHMASLPLSGRICNMGVP